MLDSVLDLNEDTESETPNYSGYVFKENGLQLWVMKNREKIVELQ